MDFNDVLTALTPQTYTALMRSVELGKWQNGRKLSPEEKANALQLLIAYDRKYKPVESRVGFIPVPDQTTCASTSTDETLIAKST